MSPKTPITVLITRFDDLLGRGLRELIEGDPSLTVVASDVEPRRISVVMDGHRPDVAVLDIAGLEKPAEVRELSARHPDTRLVLIADETSMAESAQLLAFGASACLGRGTQSRDVLNAIHLASRGLQLVPRATHGPGSESGSNGGTGLLTRREAEVLPLLAQGRTNAQIALVLGVGVETIRTHARNVYRKLGVSSRRELSTAGVRDPRQGPAPLRGSPRARSFSPMSHPRRGHRLRRG